MNMSFSTGGFLVMNLPSSLPPVLRAHARSTLLTRIERAETAEWRRLWESDLLLLDGRTNDALLILSELRQHADATVATFASLSLGQWYGVNSQTDRAEEAYRDALTLAPTTELRLHVLLAQAEFQNATGQWQACADTLHVLANNIAECPTERAQSLMNEYGRALLKLGRDSEAHHFFDRMLCAFPERTELPKIRELLQGS